MVEREVPAVSGMHEFFEGTIAQDFFHLVCGDYLGSGQGRQVYSCRISEDLVVKFEQQGGSFQNVLEWQTWQAMEHCPDQAKWLAPCHSISRCGTALLQARTRRIKNLKDLPTDIPYWATDEKSQNWGLLKGKPVMHDYGVSLLLSPPSMRLKKAKWWTE